MITSQSIIRSLEKSINQRFRVPGKKKLIIYTDRGTQFSSKAYNTFIKRYNEYFSPSMIRENTPTLLPTFSGTIIGLKLMTPNCRMVLLAVL